MVEQGVVIAATGPNTVFRDAPLVVDVYGGSICDWVEKSSKQCTDQLGKFETHWIGNLQTDQRVEFKVNVIQ